MTQQDGLAFLERISATTIANQAVLKCSVAGRPLTVDNVITFVGDFVNPANTALHPLIERILLAIEEVVESTSSSIQAQTSCVAHVA